MLYREMNAVCSQTQTKHKNTLCGLKVEFFNDKPGGTYGYHWTHNWQIHLGYILTLQTQEITWITYKVSASTAQ